MSISKQQHQCEVMAGESCGNQDQHAGPKNQQHRAARTAHRPAPRDPVAGKRARDKIADVGAKKRDPESQDALFKTKASAAQIDCEPIRDKEPVRIQQKAAADNPPRLPITQQLAPGDGAADRYLGLWRAPATDVIQFLRRQARVLFRRTIEPAPS